MRILLPLLVSAIPAFAQPLTVGAKVGVPATDFLSTVQSSRFGFNSSTQRYIVGATAELRLPKGLGIEFDALFRRFHYDGSSNLADVLLSNRTTGNAWEFPLLFKYRFPTRVVRPYFDAGMAWDTLSGLQQTITQTVSPSRVIATSSGSPQELKNNTSKGVVLGFGLEIRALLLRISPEVRFTHWGSDHFSDVNGLLRSNRNQGEVMVGITF